MPLIPGFAGNSAAALDFVGQGWGFFEDKALLFMNKSLGLIDDLLDVGINVAPSNFSITFPDVAGLTTFNAPPVPVLDDITFNPVTIPDVPQLQLPIRPEQLTAPAFDVPDPGIVLLPTQPGNFSATDPGDAPELTILTLPAAPTIVLPELPAFLTITIPEAPEINQLAFEGHDPGDAPMMPNLAGVGFTEQPYTREVLDSVVIKVREMLAGNGGLPVAIEFQLFERARDQLSKANTKARHEIADEFAGMGFAIPPGAMAKRLDEQSQTHQGLIADSVRAQAIEMAKERLADVRAALQQGIAIEQLLIGQHSQMMDRSLQSARLILDTHVSLFNAQVSGYNASIQRLQVDAAVFESRIKAELSKVELFKGQVEGQRAIADVNKSFAEMYDSQVKGVLTLVEVYKGQIAGVEAQARIEASRIEAYRSKVGAFGERVKAYEAEWGGYTAAVNAQQGKFRNFEIGVNAYSARVGAWAQAEKSKSDRYESDIRAANLTLEGYRTRVTGALAQLQAETARIGAIAQKGQAQATIYSASAQVETARNDAHTRAFVASMELAEKQTSLQLEQARVRLQESQSLLAVQVESIKGAVQAITQLTASVFSGVNFSAGISGSGSESSSFSYSLSQSQGFNWSGETEDNNAPPSY